MSKKKHTNFTFHSLIRLIIFSVVIFFTITFIANQKLNSSKISDPTISLDEEQSNLILGKTTEIGNNIYQSIPENSRKQLENLNQTPVATFVQEKVNSIKEASIGFPQKQIKEVQKMIIQNIYENSIRNIDSQ